MTADPKREQEFRRIRRLLVRGRITLAEAKERLEKLYPVKPVNYKELEKSLKRMAKEPEDKLEDE